MYIGIRVLSKGFIIETMNDRYEVESEAVMSAKDVKSRVGELLEKAKKDKE